MKARRIFPSLFSVLVPLLLTLSTSAQPVITNQPQTQAVAPGATATFMVGVSGTEPLGNQWQRNVGAGFSDITDRTNATLVLTNVQPWDAADYRVLVSNLSGTRTSAVARLHVLSAGLLTNRIVLDDFDDNTFTGRVEGKGSVVEVDHQFSVLGSFPLPTHSTYDSYVIGGYQQTWTVQDGTTLEWRVDLIRLDENATNTALLSVGSDTGAGYIFHKGREFALMLKWSSSGSYCLLSCERAALKNTNVVLVFAVRRVQPNLVLTTRVFDKADPTTVLYQHSVVDTPNADTTLSASQFQVLTGIQLNDVDRDLPEAPPATLAAWLGVFQDTDGKQPVPQATFDNFELWTYRVPIVRYVDANSANPKPPYTNWLTAARVIQDAVDVALAGDEIIVTNGMYAIGGRTVGTNLLVNRVAVDKPLMVRSVNGPPWTFIHGAKAPNVGNGPGAVRCVALTDSAVLSGFTLTNGATAGVVEGGPFDLSGGGVWCVSTNSVLTNCVITGNIAYADGGGVYGGTLYNCTVAGNSASPGFWGGWGGGAFESTLFHCTLDNNSAAFGGGAGDSTLHGCTVSNNSADGWGGGVSGCTLYNCALIGNSATRNDGYGGGAKGSTMYNCTVTGNSAKIGGGSVGGSLNNCIVYFNTAGNGPNHANTQWEAAVLNHCCTTPLPTNGLGNIDTDPLFVNAAAGDFDLRPDSPCIDVGTNLSALLTTDLDGRPRPLDGNGDGVAAFDMGAYEFDPLSVVSAFTGISCSSANLTLAWNDGAKGMKLQRTSSLTQAKWQDVPGSEGVNAFTLPLANATEFFRLVKP